MTVCSNEAVLRTLTTRDLASVLVNPPLILFDAVLAPRQNTLFQTFVYDTGSDVVMLLSLSFAVDDEDQIDERRFDFRAYDLNEKDSQVNVPLLLGM